MIPYQPEALTDFTRESEAQKFAAALARATAECGQDIPILINGCEVPAARTFASVNPSSPDEWIGHIARADRAIAEKAVLAADQGFRSWSRVSAEARADVLFKAAALLRRQKHDFSAWLLLEAGKSRAEADADTAEAIDFLEYYGRQMIGLAQRGSRELICLAGERNRMEYLPLGVGIIIPPWNFPLAILAGMTASALVTGNTVVLKPSSQTPVIAYRFVRLLLEAGLPPEALQFVPGSGGEIGDTLVGHPRTRFISFTGSREVGVHLHELSARVQPGQIWLKRFVGEMGGKDAILVDEDADLEAAARTIVVSAFGYSGQKCSACSRAILHRNIYDEVLEQITELARGLKVGDVRNADNFTGPVIDKNARDSIVRYLEIGRQEGRLVCGGQAMEGPGYFIQPTVIADAAPDARIMQEEIFGPVLAVARAKDFSEALDIANGTEFGLTGSVFTRNRRHIERAREEFHVGNLYVNRKCTGAVVGVHPFGGFNMSGTDSKAGGPDYLLLFTQAKATSELL
jgi:1-pyrroline-5-carboxylate dehydrogenase